MKNNYTKEDAKLYAEGNQDLEKILLFCLENDIITNACCGGHYERIVNGKRGSPYLSFVLNEQMVDFVNSFLLSKLITNSLYSYGLMYVDYPNLKRSLFSIRLKKGNWQCEKDFDKVVQSFFQDIYDFLNTYITTKEETPQLTLFKKLKGRYCRFELTFECDCITKMYIQTPNPKPINGYNLEQKGMLALYTQNKKVELKEIEELIK